MKVRLQEIRLHAAFEFDCLPLLAAVGRLDRGAILSHGVPISPIHEEHIV